VIGGLIKTFSGLGWIATTIISLLWWIVRSVVSVATFSSLPAPISSLLALFNGSLLAIGILEVVRGARA
jgi:hypothetical protein